MFISKLPEGYHTLAGTSVTTTQLSGGQRQRVCIARAIVRNPRILLLDEATSALDTESERIVQESLDRLVYTGAQACTTIMIAHRLSTVTNADKIVVLDRGNIVEMGTHSELMSKPDGLYAAMRAVQDLAHSDNKKSVAIAVDGVSQHAVDTKELNPHLKPNAYMPAPGKMPEGAGPAAADEEDRKKMEEKEKLNSEELMMQEAEELPPVPFSRMWKMHKGQELSFFIGSLGAFSGGCIQPLFSLIYADIIVGFFEPDEDLLRAQSRKFLGYFFCLGCAAFIAVSVRVSLFSRVGEKLTRNLRLICFQASLQQSMSFYDNPKNSVGRLTTRLATDATLVKGATGDSIGTCLEGFACICATMVIGFTASPELAGILVCVFPLLVAGSVYEFKNVSQQNKASNKVLERAGEIVSDAMVAIRTVTAFNLQGPVMALFDESLKSPLASGKKRGWIQGVGAGSKQFVLMNTYALAFWVGSIFISEGRLTFQELMRVFLAFTLASEGVGRITASAPDRAKAQAAARAIFQLIDSVGTGLSIDALDEINGEKPSEKLRGSIVFRDVTFAYPERPDVPVLKNFSLEVQAGETVALVGESGSGKSTIVQLLERFYDPPSGEVLIDGKAVSSYNVQWLRCNIGLVSQEPALFGDSINYNIAYGVPSPFKLDSNRGAPIDEEESAKKDAKDNKAKNASNNERMDPSKWLQPSEAVMQAAKDSNAHGFIEELQHTYATHCGSRGSQLSGGNSQKSAL
jgi:ATP-binding cassette subfamily B (MDR/TAP) protein 1